MRRWARLLALAAVLAAAALLLLGIWGQPGAPEPEQADAPTNSADATAGWPQSRAARSLDADLAFALRRAPDLRGALETARRQLPANSPLLRSLTEEARVVCSIVRRPDASARRVESDPNRRVWIDQLLRRCAGLLDADLAPPTPGAEALEQWNRQLPLVAAFRASIEAGVDLAQVHVAGSVDPELLAASLRFLHEQQRLPLREIFRGLAPPSAGDIESALIFAADWIACERSDSCGADGLWTLYTCAQFGCPDGSDLPRALYRILPAQQYEIAQRLVQWANAD